MPNIELRGFEPERAKELEVLIGAILRRIGRGEDAVVSIVPMEVRSCNGKGEVMPYIRICSTKREEIDLILRAFKTVGVRVDTEWLVLGGFVPAVEMAT